MGHLGNEIIVTAPPSQRALHHALTAARYLALAAVAYFLINHAKEGFSAGWKAQYAWAFLGAQAPFLAALILIAARHARMVRTPPIPLSFALKAITLASGLNLVFPARLAELLKATYLRDRCGIPLSSAIAAVFWERFLDLLVLGALAFYVVGTAAGFSWLLLAGLVISLLAIPAFGNAERFLRPLASKIPSLRVANFMQSLLKHLSLVSLKAKDPRIWLLSIAAWTLSATSVYVLIAIATARFPDPLSILGLFLAATFGLAIPLLPGGFGTFEAAVIYVLNLQGYPPGEAIVVTVMLRLHQMTLPSLGAMGILMSEKLGVASLLQRLKTEASEMSTKDA